MFLKASATQILLSFLCPILYGADHAGIIKRIAAPQKQLIPNYQFIYLSPDLSRPNLA
jgi:hypothetical protein